MVGLAWGHFFRISLIQHLMLEKQVPPIAACQVDFFPLSPIRNSPLRLPCHLRFSFYFDSPACNKFN
jgi:hypothetical protein